MQWLQSWIDDYVSSLSQAEYQFQIAVGFALMALLLYRSYRIHQRYRFISDTPTSRIASAAQGYVELKGLGELMPGSRITSPFSRAGCVWYQCIVEKRDDIHDNHENDWVMVSNETSDQLFHLQDTSGACVIDPEGAVVMPSQQLVWYGQSMQARFQAPRPGSRLARHLGAGKYRFTEKLVLVADPLYAIGWFETHEKNVSAAKFDDQVDALINQWRADPRRYLSEFETDGNGKIQQREWIPIRRKAEAIVRSRQVDTVHHVLKKPPDRSQPFIISAKPEQDMLKKKRRQVVLQLAIFFLMLYVLLSAMNAHTVVNKV